MTIENLILDGKVHTLFSGNKTMSKLHCQRCKCLLQSILKLFEDCLACKRNCLKTKFKLMSLSFYSNEHRICFYPTHCLLKVGF